MRGLRKRNPSGSYDQWTSGVRRPNCAAWRRTATATLDQLRQQCREFTRQTAGLWLIPSPAITITVGASTPAIVAAPGPDFSRVMTPGEIRPRTGPGVRVAPAVIVVLIVIAVLIEKRLQAQFHDQRQWWCHDESVARASGRHDARAEQKRRKWRDNQHSLHFHSPGCLRNENLPWKRLRFGWGPTLPKINTATDSWRACRDAGHRE